MLVILRNRLLDSRCGINVKTVEMRIWIISTRIYLKGLPKCADDNV